MRRSLYRSIGALTPQQVAATDAQLTDLTARLARQSQIINQAREAGFDRDLVGAAIATYGRLVTRLESLAAQSDAIPEAAFAEWRQRLQSFGTEVDVFETQVQEQLGGAAMGRNVKIILSTVGAIGVAAVLGGLLWYSTQPGRVLASKRWRKR